MRIEQRRTDGMSVDIKEQLEIARYMGSYLL